MPPAGVTGDARPDHPRQLLSRRSTLVGMRSHTLILASLLALVLAPPAALAGSNDATATAAYVRANYALVAAARAKLGSSEAALKTLLGRLRRECPGVAAESPQDKDSEQLTNEVVGTMTIAALHADVPAIAAYTRAVAPLRWSNPKLTSRVRSYARALKAQASLSAPDLCGDLRAWASSGFRTLPASTGRFNRSFSPVYVAVGMLPARLLAPYVSPAQRTVLRRTKELELELTDGYARAVWRWGQVMEALALNP